MGRSYHTLAKKYACAGMRGSDVGRVGGGSSDGSCFIDAVIEDGRELERLWARIGSGVAMAVRRVRPSDRGTRVSITDRVLVDRVCLHDMPLGAVLAAAGWVSNGRNVKAVRLALCDALERMTGGRIGSRIQAKAFGVASTMGRWE